MKTFSTGPYDRVTIWEYDDVKGDIPAVASRLMGMATSATEAEAICEALNWVHRLAAANGREIVDIMREIRGEAV